MMNDRLIREKQVFLSLKADVTMKFSVSTFLFLILSVSAFSSDTKFYRINEIYGINNREAYSICKDENGFIWAATKTGILRVTDGDCRVYELPAKTINFVSVKLSYHDQQLFAYTNTGQIFRYKEPEDQFFFVKDLRELLDDNSALSSTVVSKKGALWIASSAGLFRYKDDSLLKVTDSRYGIDYMISYDEDHLLYTTFDGINLLHTTTFKTERLYTSQWNRRFQVTACYLDEKQQKLWIGTESSGLFFFDLQANQLLETTINDFPKQPIHAIIRADNNTFLVGIDGQGIWNVDDSGQILITTYTEDMSNPFSLRGDGVYDLFCNDMRIWVATYTGGLSFFEKNNPAITQLNYQVGNTNSLGNNYVNKILEDSDGRVWFATNNGLSCWNVQASKWEHYYQNKKEQAKVFLALCEDKQGRIWAGSFSSGVYVLDKNTGKELHHYSSKINQPPLGFNSDFILDIFMDSDGDIWIGNLHDLYCFQQKNSRFISYSAKPVNSFAELTKEIILFTTSTGLFSLNKVDGNMEHLIEGVLSQDFLIQGNNVWIATGGEGLIKYDYLSRKTSLFTVESGLSSNYVNSLLYSAGFLWIGTENGLCRLNTNNNTINSYSSVYHLSTAYNVNSCLKLNNGELIWGTGNGAILFDPNAISEIRPDGRIFFQDLSVSGNSIRKNPDLLKNTPVNLHNNIALAYNQNNFVLELISIGKSTMGAKFSWKMEGVDTDWSKPSELHLISYSNLPNGNFSLAIRMYDSSLSQILDERSFGVTIMPPFWMTWWLRVIVILLVIGLVIYISRSYSNLLKQRYANEKLRFFTNMAHDIRTSLTLIKAPVEELNQASELSKRSRYYAGIANEQSTKLTLVADQLLDLQKLDKGKEQLYLSIVDIVKLVSGRVFMFESAANKKNIELCFSSNQKTYVTTVDEIKIEKVVDNLLSNAIKYSYPDSKVIISLRLTDIDWQLEITDHGIGISEKAKKKLFKEFYRGENAINSKIIGSGIGLLLIKSYTQLHKGKVSFNSTKADGTSFSITIPFNEKVENDTSTTAKEEEISDLTIPLVMGSLVIPENDVDKRKKPYILIVEDNDELRNFLHVSFSEHYHIRAAENGEEAWQQIQKKAPDLVISDIMMPQMDGFVLCKLIKSDFDTSHIPVILLTAFTDKAKQLAGLGLGADDYVTKPFDMSVLQKRIQTIIYNRNVVKEKAIRFINQDNDKGHIVANELNDKFVKKALTIVKENIGKDGFGKDEFASAMCVSSSLLYKKLKAITGQSPTDFIKSIRMNHALELLQSHQYSVTEISELSGFSSLTAFGRAFKAYFGKAPTDV